MRLKQVSCPGSDPTTLEMYIPARHTLVAMYSSTDKDTTRGADPAFKPRGTASNSVRVPRRANLRSFALSDLVHCATTQPPRHSRLRRRVPCCPNRRVVRPVESKSSSLRSASRVDQRRTCCRRWSRQSRLLDERHRRVSRGVERRESRKRMDRRAVVLAGEPRTRTTR